MPVVSDEPSAREQEIIPPSRNIVPRSLRPSQSEPAPLKNLMSGAIDANSSVATIAGASVGAPSVSGSGKNGRGKRGSGKVIDYDKLTKKKKAEYSTIELFANFLADIQASEAQEGRPKRLSTGGKAPTSLFAGCRIFYLLHPSAGSKLEELDRIRMRRITQEGGTVESRLQLGMTTHVLTSKPRQSMGWETCWKALRAQLQAQGQDDADTVSRLKNLLHGPPGGVAGKDLIWLVDQPWLVESLKANSERPHPERYFRIEPASVRRSNTGLSKSGASHVDTTSPAVAQDFIGSKKDAFRERHGNEADSTQNSAFHTSDYVSSTTSPEFILQGLSPEPPVNERNGKPLRPLPTSSAAPGHRALRHERNRRRSSGQSQGELGGSQDEVQIETSNIREDPTAGHERDGEANVEVDASVYRELAREIELARLGEGQEEEYLLYNSDEGEPDTDELGSDEEELRQPKKAKRSKQKVGHSSKSCSRSRC